MSWSFRLCHVFGIEIRLHWIFVFLVAAFGYEAWLSGGPGAGAAVVITVLMVFLFVTLHELGHSLVARANGVTVQDITLLPIGGISRLSHIPEDPNVELKISVCGPAVNVAFVLLLLPIYFIVTELHFIGSLRVLLRPSPGRLTLPGVLGMLIYINVMLAVFNIIPAFPMDGGRILRALLAKFFTFVTATKIAARIGRGIAVGTVVIGFAVNHNWMFNNFLLIIIAMFIYMASLQEERMVVYQHMRPAPEPEEEPEEEEDERRPRREDMDDATRAFVDLARKLDDIDGRHQLGR